MHANNLPNQYQERFPNFDSTPKSVIAAIAISLALRACEDDFNKAIELIRGEWKILHQNNIVPQAPKY